MGSIAAVNIDGNEITHTKLDSDKPDLPKQYKPILLIHFEELNQLWPSNPRIPSVQSRRAWALARDLNPTNVNNWWYRRRKVARKLKMSIPRDTYELDVGVPPLIDTGAIKEEFCPDMSVYPGTEDSDKRGLDDRTPASPYTHIPGSDDSDLSFNCSADTLVPSSPNSSENLENGLGKHQSDAYIDQCQLTDFGTSGSLFGMTDTDVPETLSFDLENGKVTPTSRSPSPCTLTFRSDHYFDSVDSSTFLCDQITVSETRADRDILWTSFRNLENFYPIYVLPTVDLGIPLSSCAAQPFWRASSSSEHADVFYIESSNNAPWCIGGFRVQVDGSSAGICSCYYPIVPSN